MSVNMINEDCLLSHKLCVLVKQRKNKHTGDVIRVKDNHFVSLPGYGALAGIGYPGAQPGK